MTATTTQQNDAQAAPMKLRKTAAGLIAYCKAQLGKPYWYGTFGQVSTATLLEYNRKRFPTMYKATDFNRQIGQKVHDCIGLIKGYMWSKDAYDEHPKYASNGFADKNADTYYRGAKRKGVMADFPDVAGVAVFMSGHVGVYIGNGEVIEARGHAYGVVKTKLKDRKWVRWAYIDEISYE